jgi:hypothetical protein
MGQLKFIGGIMMLMVFTIAIIGYATDFGTNNDAGTRIDDLDNGLTDLKTNVSTTIDNQRLNVTNSNEGFFESSIDTSGDVDATTVTGGQFKTIMTSPASAVKTILTSINKNIFGGSTQFGIVLTALVSFLIIAGILYIWKTWKGGNPN